MGFEFFLSHFPGRIKIGGRRRIPGRPCAIMIRNMEDGAARALFPVALLAGLLLICGAASAQLVLGQYEDEAPLGTWNIFGAPSAPAVGLGGVQFARAWDSSVSLTNPALLLTLPRLSAFVSASYAVTTLFKYSLVNTGVVASSGNLAAGILGLDCGGLSFRSGKWALGVAVAVPESYGRPKIVVGSSDGVWSDRLTLDQTGYLRIFHAGIACRRDCRWAWGSIMRRERWPGRSSNRRPTPSAS